MMESQNTGRPAQMMTFSNAITSCLINNYFNFSGRASRSEYWWFVLFSFLLGVITGMVDIYLFGWELDDPTWISDIASIALLLPSWGVWWRRLHDVGKSGWWTLLAFTIIGIIPLFIWSVSEGEEHANQYGEVPTNMIKRELNIYNNY